MKGMLYFRLRFFLVAICLALGFLLHWMVGFMAALPAYLAGILLLFSFLVLGTVGPAFARLRKGKIEEARTLLGLTHFPNWLLKRHKAYYHFCYGMIDLQQEKLQLAETHLLEATRLGLRNDNDQALASLNLAHIYYVTGKKEKSILWAAKAKAYDPNDLMILEKLKELRSALGMKDPA
ncbi:MAG: hypothetical protein HKN16_02720 [Saprospiraceae bacterium]|nr:hypothetical protein [Saprospiraceae bacterium]